MTLRIVFMGTPAFAAVTLRHLHECGHDIAAVYTQPPRPGGRRGLAPVRSEVHVLAESLGLAVRTPASLRSKEAVEAFRALDADVAIVIAYGLILPPAILSGTRHGALNAHASALPRWRGAAPIQRAIMAGDRSTALCIMRMDEGLDTGPVALEQIVEIGPDETAGELHDRLAAIAATQMAKALDLLEAGKLAAVPQPADGATYAAKIDKQETRIDWHRPARLVHDHIRGLSPFPGAWCRMRIGGSEERVKVLGSRLADGAGPAGGLIGSGLVVACAEGAVELTRLQRAGGRALEAAEFLRGAPIEAVS